MIVPFGQIVLLAGLLSTLGLVCIVVHRNWIMILVGVEIMMNGSAVAFIGTALRWQLMEGQAFVIFILAVAAAEVSVGLAMVLNAYRRTGSIDPDRYNVLKG